MKANICGGYYRGHQKGHKGASKKGKKFTRVSVWNFHKKGLLF